MSRAVGHSDKTVQAKSPSSEDSFDQLLRRHLLPPPGPLYYAARRKLWLTPRSQIRVKPEQSSIRQRLEELLSQPGAVESDELWKAGIENVWKGLLAGGRLKKRLPMGLVVRGISLDIARAITDPLIKLKIIHAGWLRDPSTWPPGAIAPEPDDILEESNTLSSAQSPSISSWAAMVTPIAPVDTRGTSGVPDTPIETVDEVRPVEVIAPAS